MTPRTYLYFKMKKALKICCTPAGHAMLASKGLYPLRMLGSGSSMYKIDVKGNIIGTSLPPSQPVGAPMQKFPQGIGRRLAIVGESGQEMIVGNPGERIFPVFPPKLMDLPSGTSIIPIGSIDWTLPPAVLIPRDKTI